MSLTRVFDCEQCGAFGKITLKGDDHSIEDIAYCPICGADIEDDKDEVD